MSQLFTELMKDDQIKRAVLVHFGFGNVNKSKVNKWVKEQFPTQFAEIKKNIKSGKIVEFDQETEMTTRQERDAFLDRVMGILDSMQERKVVQVYEDDWETLNENFEQVLNKYEEEVYNHDGLGLLIYDFIIENGLGDKFYGFLKENKNSEGYPTDIEHMMMDYQP